jgi:hypothetical protein
MKKTFIIFSVLVGLATAAQAQFSQFHAGFSFPSGKFGDGESLFSNKGSAATGLTAGYKRYNPLGVENLTWVFGIEAFANGVNSDVKDGYDDLGWDDLTFPIYVNVPATFGLNYSIPLNGDLLKIYGEAAAGANFSMITNFLRSDRPNYQDAEIRFTPAFGFAYALEGGLFIKNKYSIGIRTNNLGSYKYKYEVEFEDGEVRKEKYSRRLPITSISLCAGILF